VCISNGSDKMSVKGKGRMKNLIRYECKKKECGKLWSLHPDGCFHTGTRIFCGYDRNGYKKYRMEGHCNCGTKFECNHAYLDRK
jgi:hypothetical protein